MPLIASKEHLNVMSIDRPQPLSELQIGPAAPPVLIVGLFLVAAAATLAAVGISSTAVNDQILWGAIALAAFCTGLLLLMSALGGYGGLGLGTWRIGPWSLAWGALTFGLATISRMTPQTGSPAEISPGSVPRALWLIAVAMALFTIGYCAGPRRLASSLARRATESLTSRFTDDIRGPAVPWILFGAGVAGVAASALMTHRLGYVGSVATSVTSASGYAQYLVLLGECLPLAVAAASMRAHRTRRLGAWLTLAVVFVVAMIAGAIAGGKTSFVVAVLAVVIPRTVIRRRFPVGLLLIAIAFFLLIIIPFNQAYRTSARGAVTLTTSEAVAAAPAIVGQVLASDFSSSVLGQSAGYLAQRIRTIDSPAIIMQRTPGQIPYSNPGQLAVSPVLDLIPRILWPGKPILDVGYQMSQEYYQLPPQVYTSSNITPEGDLYRHGGWFVVVIGMFLIGCGARIVDEVTDLRRSIHGTFLILLLFPGLVLAGSDVATLAAGIPGMVLLWFVVVALSFSRRTARGAGARVPGPPVHSRSLSRPV
jgi:hypothetical protein